MAPDDASLPGQPMTDDPAPSRPSGPPSAADLPFVMEILSSECALEMELVGQEAARRAATGGEFASEPGGRHLEMIESLSLLSSVATLAQFLLVAVPWAKSKLGGTAAPATQPELAEVRRAVEQAFAEDERVREVLQEDPQLLDRVCRTISNRSR